MDHGHEATPTRRTGLIITAYCAENMSDIHKLPATDLYSLVLSTVGPAQ